MSTPNPWESGCQRSSNCPHWVPQGTVRRNTRWVPGGTTTEAVTWAPQEEDTAKPVTPRRAVTDRSLPPEIWKRILAKGQSSTDLIMTESHRGISVFGYRCPRRARVLGYTQIGIVRRPFVRRYGARQVWIGDAPRGRSQNETKGGGGNHRESPSIAKIQQPTRPLVKG